MLNAFTIDVEDYFQVSAFERDIPRNTWDSFEVRVVDNTYRVLDLLALHGVRGTFFVLGWVAERFPGLVRDIHACGHEIGSHSYWHRLVYQQTPQQFREDLVASRDVLQDTIGNRVTAYRAPSFSIRRDSWWAMEILVEEGFEIDSSVFPVRHDRYGVPDADRQIHSIDTPAGSITEFPLPVKDFGRWRLPVGGGGYFRLYPRNWTYRWLREINEVHSRPFAFYAHPWEVDPEQPRMQIRSKVSRFRHYVNQGSTHEKLNSMLSRFEFGTMAEVTKVAA